MKRVILISGKLQSGKNQFADYLDQALQLKGVKTRQDLFAKPVKDWSKDDFKPLTTYINDVVDEVMRYVDCGSTPSKVGEIISQLKTKPENFYEDKTDLTRIILQMYGTEIFRKRVKDSYWVDYMIEKIRNMEEDVIIITDVRFPNEIDNLYEELFSKFDVIPIKVERDIERNGKEHEHDSEIALDDYLHFEYIIENNGTLEELWESADVICNNLECEENLIIEK